MLLTSVDKSNRERFGILTESFSFNWNGKKVLIIEDDYVNYLYVRDILSQTKIIIKRAISLNQLYSQYRSFEKIDLIIINLNIEDNQDCDGVRMIKQLHPQIPVIGITGYDSIYEERYRYLEAGCDTFISKHLDSDQLLSTINELIYKYHFQFHYY